MLSTRGVLLSLIGLLPPPSLGAQQMAAPGARVRAVDVDGQTLATGAFVRLTGDTLVLTDATGMERALALQPGRRFEISTGKHRRTLPGMGVGLLVGAGVGALVGAASYKPVTCVELCIGPHSASENALIGAVIFGVPGMVIGGIVGSWKRERWSRVILRAPRIVLLPTGFHSAAFTATIRLQ